MKPSEECKTSGLKGLEELSEMSEISVQTLINWHKSDKCKAFRLLLRGASIEKEEMDMGIKVDKSANWKLYTNQAPVGFEMMGVVKRGVETGALARNTNTGIYVMVNAGVLQSLPQKAVASAV